VWLIPGTVLLASRSPLAIGAGLVAVIGSAGLLAARLVPRGLRMKPRRRRRRKTEPLLFRYQSARRPGIFRQAGPTFIGALALQTGIYALSGEYPLLAAVSFAIATAIWTAMSVARGAADPAGTAGRPYSALRMILTLLLAVTLTAALMHTEILQEGLGYMETAAIPVVTASLLQRLVHVPPVPAWPPGAAGSKKTAGVVKKEVLTRLVSAAPAAGTNAANGVPGVIMRPRIKPNPRSPLTRPQAGPRLAPAEPLALPFTGEYHLFRANSGGLPKEAVVETGTPLEHVYAMNDGAPMETVAVQTFDPPIDLSLWSKVLVTLTSAEAAPVLASMQLVAEDSVEDGGTDLMGMTPERRQVLEFRVPFTPRTLLVHAVWISFLRPGPDRDKNVQLAVEQITLVPR
jgi:hypothetical protein